MKLVSWYCTPPQRRGSAGKFISSPYLSIRSLKSHKATEPSTYLIHALFFSSLTMATLVLAHMCLLPLNFEKTLLLAPAIYFLTETMGALGQLAFAWSIRSFPIHHHPLFSTSLSQFWGCDWNLWVQDWLKDTAIKFNGSRVTITFLISGFFHEIMVNFPYWLVFKKSYFGTMMLYFSIQAAGLWIDKKYIRSLHPIIQKAYLWIIVILPSPLFINVPLLTFLGVINE